MLARMPVFALLALLLLLGPAPWTSPCTQAAPWDGIVGFLRAVSALQAGPHEPELSIDEDQPIRKIVYAVEEQVSGDGNGERNASVIIYDSLQDNGANSAVLDESKNSRKKRSSTEPAASDVGNERAGTGVVARPFLIGRKLWYVPLWFAVYLILYITALTVKSVARHRIKYPTLVSDDDAFAKRRNGYVKPDGITRRISNGIANAEHRYQRQWSM